MDHDDDDDDDGTNVHDEDQVPYDPDHHGRIFISTPHSGGITYPPMVDQFHHPDDDDDDNHHHPCGEASGIFVRTIHGLLVAGAIRYPTFHFWCRS